MKRFLFYTFILACAFACNSNVKKYYYDTGELKGVDKIISNDPFQSYYTEYYKNGKVSSEGYWSVFQGDTVRNGFSKYYYSDGTLKWEGYVENGIIIYDIDTIIIAARSQSPTPYIEIGKPFKFRIIVENMFPEDYILTIGRHGEYIPLSDFRDDFPYTVTVTEEELLECDEYNNLKCTELPIVIYLLPQPSKRKKNEDGYIELYREDLPSTVVMIPIKRE